ncbi:hypothetical protein RYX36_007335 [Vicia faba]
MNQIFEAMIASSKNNFQDVLTDHVDPMSSFTMMSNPMYDSPLWMDDPIQPQILVKPVNISATKQQHSDQPSIKVVGIISTSNKINNHVSIKAIIDKILDDNKYVLKHNLSLMDTIINPLAEPPHTKSTQPIGNLCHKRRRPCHGWISSDDGEEDLI